MSSSVEIEFLPAESLPDNKLTYVIIGAREDDKWIFVRHRERETWELPAGHIEEGEGASKAAIRELHEETGTTEGKLRSISDYSVNMNGETKYGRIFFATVLNRGELPDTEIAEIRLAVRSPKPATYPYAHWKFIDVLDSYLSNTK